ncbi:MAG TPA: dihydroneopterin aldolase [Thermomicrobiaceae bacterium]|nr:dihydroneopterin aldolase [Thermomicrobiaceae bacterium]
MATDRVFLEGMVFYGYHGVHVEERRLGQRFVVDLVVSCDLRPAGQSDRVEETVSYSDLYRIAREVVEGPPRDLIEVVAEHIAGEVLQRLPLVEDVQVTVRKPGAPIRGSVLDAVGVSIRRVRAASETGGPPRSAQDTR